VNAAAHARSPRAASRRPTVARRARRPRCRTHSQTTRCARGCARRARPPPPPRRPARRARRSGCCTRSSRGRAPSPAGPPRCVRAARPAVRRHERPFRAGRGEDRCVRFVPRRVLAWVRAGRGGACVTSRTSCPSMSTRPSVGSYRRRRSRPTVVLPEPDSPTKATVSPGSTEKDTLRSTGRAALYANETFSKSMRPAATRSGGAPGAQDALFPCKVLTL